MKDILKHLFDEFVLALPNFLSAIGLLIAGWILARIIAGLLRKLLVAIKVDKFAERLNDIDLIGKSNFKFVPSVFLSKIVYYFILFAFLIGATDVLNIKAVTDLMTNILNYIPILFSAMFVFIIGLFIADALKKIVLTTCKSLGIPAAGLISNIFFYFLFVNILMVTLSQAMIDTDFIQDNLSIILAGIVLAFAIGYGLASKDIVANFIASFYNKNKVKLGDNIVIDGIEGVIINLDNTSLTLKAKDGRIIVPLSKLSSSSLLIKD